MSKKFFEKRFSLALVIAAIVLGAIVCMLSTIAYGVKKAQFTTLKIAVGCDTIIIQNIV